jgi:RNA polymerase sigma-70 factor (ECF subfamily)
MTDNYHDACDIVQDAFVAAYNDIRGFQGKARFATWLSTITMNLARNRLKQVKTERSRQGFSLDAPLMTEDGEVRMEIASKTPSVLDQLETLDVQKSVQDCINALDEDFKAVVVLREMQGFAYEEISDMLQTAIGTVKSRLFRAREMLKNCLKSKLGEL